MTEVSTTKVLTTALENSDDPLDVILAVQSLDLDDASMKLVGAPTIAAFRSGTRGKSVRKELNAIEKKQAIIEAQGRKMDPNTDAEALQAKTSQTLYRLQ